jgi:hypothetical protein
VARILQFKPITQRSGEFSAGTSGEISTGIDSRHICPE